MRGLLFLIFLGPLLVEGEEVFLSWAWHGGYYLTDEQATRDALDALFKALEENPSAKAVLEIEPYTLERMLLGEKFDVEKKGREGGYVVGWTYGGPGKWEMKFGKGYARQGNVGVRLELKQGDYVNLCQPKEVMSLRGKTLIFSGWVRASSGGGAHLYIDAWDASRFIEGSSRFSEGVPPDGKWHFVEVKFPVPNEAVTIFPQAKIGPEPGTADFDAFSLKIEETGEEILFNGDFERVEIFTLKDLERLERLKRLVEEGKVEIVGGAYTQPIMYTIGNESVIRQFVLGCEAVERTIGKQVRIYAAQEPDMMGQLPQILRKCGFSGVLYRTSWGAFGFVPSYNAEKVWWVGPDGTRIEAIPQPEPLRIGWGTYDRPALNLVKECERVGVKQPLFMAFGDFIASWVVSSLPILKGQFGIGWINLCQRLDASGLRGKELEFSALVRARGMGAHLYIDAHNEQGGVSGSAQSPDVPADDQWHRLSLRFKVPEDAVFLFPQGRIVSAEEAQADFAVFSLKRVGEERELLANPLFSSPSLPSQWGISHSEGVEGEYEVRRGDVEGGYFVCLRMRPSPFPYPWRIVSLEEYLKEMGPPRKEWQDAYVGFEHRFPFGLLGGEPQLFNRLAEDSALRTERLLALSGSKDERVEDVWRLVLMGHHHDAWVCAPVIFGIWSRGYKSYAQLVEEAWEEVRRICADIEKNLLDNDWRRFNLVNLTGDEREDIAEIHVDLPPGVAKNPAFEAGGKLLPARVEVLSRHGDGSAKEVHAYVLAKVPSLGYLTLNIKEGTPPSLPRTRVRKNGGEVVLENPFLRLVLSKDGLLMPYSPSGQPLLSRSAFLTGRFPSGDLFSQIEDIQAKEEGPFGVAYVKGRIGNVPFYARTRLSPLSPIVDVELEFDFGDGVVVGEGESIPPGPSPRIPSWARDDLKLRLVLPLNLEKTKFYSQGAFELRKPYEERFPLIGYAIAEGEGRGIAVYVDRATAGLFNERDNFLAIVLAYGGKFIYAPGGFAPLSGKKRYKLAVNFYRGNMESAGIAQAYEIFSQPLISLPATAVFREGKFSLVRLTPSNAAVVSAVYPFKDGYILRLWRPYRESSKVKLKFGKGKEVWRADLRGNLQDRLSNRGEVEISLGKGEIVTLFVK